MLTYLAYIPLIGALIYLLYRQGLAVAKSITAVLFVFRPGKHGDSVSLDSCTGWARHMGRFRQSGTYRFCLDCPLSKGNAVLTLLDRQNRELLRLSRENPAGKIELNGNGRYYLRWEFQNATGNCELRWQVSVQGTA